MPKSITLFAAKDADVLGCFSAALAAVYGPSRVRATSDQVQASNPWRAGEDGPGLGYVIVSTLTVREPALNEYSTWNGVPERFVTSLPSLAGYVIMFKRLESLNACLTRLFESTEIGTSGCWIDTDYGKVLPACVVATRVREKQPDWPQMSL